MGQGETFNRFWNTKFESLSCKKIPERAFMIKFLPSEFLPPERDKNVAFCTIDEDVYDGDVYANDKL